MAEHTKGPWRVDGPNGYINQIGIGPSIGAAYGAGEEVKANAPYITGGADARCGRSCPPPLCARWMIDFY